MQLEEDFKAPIMLIAMPQLLDPFFHRSLVLLVHHDDEGSLGFIVNRPTAIHVGEILEGMEISWRGSKELKASFGGPVQPQLGTVIFSLDDPPTTSAAEVVPGLSLTQHVEDLAAIAEAPPDDFRLMLGYAGWGEGQLMGELLRNDWLTAPVQRELVFATEAEEVWERALRSVGADPTALLSWSGGDEGDQAN